MKIAKPVRCLKYILIFPLLFCMTGTGFAQLLVSIQMIIEKQHPRILLLKGEESQIDQSIADNPVWKKMHEAILKECDKIIALPPVENVKIGRRLLDKSREALRRIFFLSYACRMTGQEKYFLRAEKELLAVSRFDDWNPPHFLDTAEMTMAAAIGYDWLYPKLSEDSRKVIREAIVNKGLNQSLDPKSNGWLKGVNNWNQVCSAGMTYGALAVAEDYPELSKNIIERALVSIHLPMGEYKPDGAYPEGYSYWDYGTSFNVMFLSALEKIFSSDFGLNKTPGFLQTAGFLQNMTGVTGLCYNWGDSGPWGGLSPAMFWFAQRNNDLSLLWVERACLQKSDYSKFTRNRLLPAVMIWGKEFPLDKVPEPKVKAWKGQGANPVCLMRTSWTDPDAIYLGFKAGSPAVNHGHMDIGSFVMEAEGVRWASDLGMQDYESLESKGIALWGRTQDSQRWKVFRINNFAHSTLTIDNQLQQVKGYARIDKFSDNPDFMYAISDLTTVYEKQLASVKRGVAVVDGKFVVIGDELAAGDNPATVRWAMLTQASPEFVEKGIILSKDGKKLVLKVNTPAEVTMKQWSTAPTTNYDAANPGTTLVGFELRLEPRQDLAIQVLLIPGSADGGQIKFEKALVNW